MCVITSLAFSPLELRTLLTDVFALAQIGNKTVIRDFEKEDVAAEAVRVMLAPKAKA